MFRVYCQYELSVIFCSAAHKKNLNMSLDQNCSCLLSHDSLYVSCVAVVYIFIMRNIFICLCFVLFPPGKCNQQTNTRI